MPSLAMISGLTVIIRSKICAALTGLDSRISFRSVREDDLQAPKLTKKGRGRINPILEETKIFHQKERSRTEVRLEVNPFCVLSPSR